jgi:hypothetical protein
VLDTVLRFALIIAPLITASPSHASSSQNCPTLIGTFSEAEQNELLSTMVLKGEGIPYKVENGINWREGGRIGAGGNIRGFEAFTPWGQIFLSEPGGKASPPSVAIRNLKVYFLSRKDQRWREILNTDSVIGRYFDPNFVNNVSFEATLKQEADYTVVKLHAFRPFHFWPRSGRISILHYDFSAVTVSFETRIIKYPPKSDEYISSAGADYWQSLSSLWDNNQTNRDVGIGRFTRIENFWRTSFMTTASDDELIRCLD